MRIEEDLELKAYITNLGKYNEGELIGEWVTFPIEQEKLDEVFKRIGIGEEDIFGQVYEEFFVTDYDGNIPKDMWRDLGEYTSIEDLQVAGRLLEKINEAGADGREIFAALMDEAGMDYLDAASAVINDECVYLAGVANDYDLGDYVVNNYGLSTENASMYFDYQSFGRDCRLDFYGDGECDDIKDYLGLSQWATDEEIGIAQVDSIGSVEDLGKETIERYVDLEMLGRDVRIEGSYAFGENGAVDYGDCRYDGGSLAEEIKDELISDGIIEDPDVRKERLMEEAEKKADEKNKDKKSKTKDDEVR